MAVRTNQGQRRLRLGRAAIGKHVYHITSATADRASLFEDLYLGRFVIQALKRTDDAGYSETLAFVVMPDHFHWLFQLQVDGKLSSTVGSVKSQSSHLIKQSIGMRRPVWQRGFYDRGIRHDDDLVQVARYIIANPLRAGLVEDVRHYSLWDCAWL